LRKIDKLLEVVPEKRYMYYLHVSGKGDGDIYR